MILKKITLLISICLFIYPAFSDIPSNKVTLANSSTIQVGLVNDGFEVTVTIGSIGYVGINFSTTMTNSDIIMVIWNGNENFEVRDTYSKGHSLPALDVDQGGNDDIRDKRLIIKDGKAIISFSRKFNTNDKYDIALTENTKLNIALAFKDGPVGWHSRSGYIYKSLSFNRALNLILFYDLNSAIPFSTEIAN